MMQPYIQKGLTDNVNMKHISYQEDKSPQREKDGDFFNCYCFGKMIKLISHQLNLKENFIFINYIGSHVVMIFEARS